MEKLSRGAHKRNRHADEKTPPVPMDLTADEMKNLLMNCTIPALFRA